VSRYAEGMTARSSLVIALVPALTLMGCALADRFVDAHDGGIDAAVAHDASVDAKRDGALAPHDAALEDAAPTPVTPDATIHAMPDAAHIADEDGGASEASIDGKPVSKFFADTCGACHGRSRQGGLGPTLIPSRLTQPRAYYVDTVTNGRNGTLMPAWGRWYTAEQIALIVDFLYTEPELDSITWEAPQITASLQVLVADDALVSAPTHAADLDLLMLVTERESSAFAVIDGHTHTVLAHVPSSYRAHGYAFHPTSKRWVYNLGRDGWLFKVDLFGLVPTRKVRVGYDSRGLAVSDDGKYVIAGNYWPNTAVIVDAVTLEPRKVIHTEGITCDGSPALSRVGIVSDTSPKLVGPYFIIGLEDACEVWRIDWSDPSFPIAKARGAGRTLHDGFLNSDQSRFFIAAQTDHWMAAIDVAQWKLVDLIPTGKAPHPGSGATWQAGDAELAATVHIGEGTVAIWDVATGHVVGRVSTAGPGLFVRGFAQSPYVWADSVLADPAHTITVFDGKSPTFEVVATIGHGTRTLHPEPTADGKFVYVADWAEDVVRVYDAAYDAVSGTFPLVTTIESVPAPTGIFSAGRRDETLGH
jgi:nitrite reductase (NO-forming) / hydroxylamine reductase